MIDLDSINFEFILFPLFFIFFLKDIKQEYENLIKEAKLVVEESEKEYSKLVKNIEIERLAKVRRNKKLLKFRN